VREIIVDKGDWMMSHSSRIQEDAVSLYTPAGFFQLRAPLFSTPFFAQFTHHPLTEEALSAADGEAVFQAHLQDGYRLIRDLVAHSPLLQTALVVASSDIHEGITRIQHDASGSTRRTRHAYSRLLRYITRMSTRPTPFGVFAGVAPGSFASHTAIELRQPVIRLRPDMGWLLSLIQRLEQDPELFPEMTLIRNSTAYVIGNRVILPSADIYGTQDTRSILVHYHPLVQQMMELALQPITSSQLVRQLHQAFPDVSEAQIQHALVQLWDIHLFLSTLRPPFTQLEPITFLLERLHALTKTQALQEDLHRLFILTRVVHQHGIDASTPKRIEAIVSLQKQLVPDYKQQPFQVDTAWQVGPALLHQSIAEAAAKAAEVLLRVSKHPRGLPALNQYRAAFVKKYGMAEIPLLQLLSSEGGLGAPPTYFGPPREYPLPEATSASHDPTRDRILARWLEEALNTESREIHLIDKQVNELAQWTPCSQTLPPALLEVFLQIQASSQEAIDRGAWDLLILQGVTFGGRALSRFVDLLDEEGKAQLQAYLRAEEALFPDVIFADLNYLPFDGRCGNVSLRPSFHAYEIAVHTMPSLPPENVLPLDDLVVGVRQDRFYVRSRRLGKQVNVSHHTMLHPRFAPNVCRFLLEVAWDGCPYPGGFDWGLLSHVPFLPRLTYEKCVLSLAEWNVRPADIQPRGQGTDDLRWFRGLQHWRKQWHVPRYVYLTALDRRLLLDLDSPLLAQELRWELQTCRQGTSLVLQEMLPDFQHLWLHNTHYAPYMAELVVPLIINRDALHTAEKRSHASGMEVQQWLHPHHVPDGIRSRFPGEEWVYLKVYASRNFHDELITRSISTLVETVRNEHLCDRWFYLRYADPEPHLRLRFHAANDRVKEPLLLSVLEWSRHLTRESCIPRICLDTYEREVERYGGPACIDVIEQFFSLNSDAMSAVVAALFTQKMTLDRQAVAVFCLDRLFSAWGYDFPARLAYARTRTHHYEAIEAFRERRSSLSELLCPWKKASESELHTQRELLMTLLSVQEAQMPPIVSHLRTLAEQKALWQPLEQIVGSLAHMQLNRLMGLERKEEQTIYAFWRHTLESIQKRPDSSKHVTGTISGPVTMPHAHPEG
jgi:thiopeptide-type bacteriocin biosynthesis protein